MFHFIFIQLPSMFCAGLHKGLWKRYRSFGNGQSSVKTILTFLTLAQIIKILSRFKTCCWITNLMLISTVGLSIKFVSNANHILHGKNPLLGRNPNIKQPIAQKSRCAKITVKTVMESAVQWMSAFWCGHLLSLVSLDTCFTVMSVFPVIKLTELVVFIVCHCHHFHVFSSQSFHVTCSSIDAVRLSQNDYTLCQ